MRAYGQDLAHIHDTGFTSFVQDASPGILKLLRGQGIADGLVIDLGCGSGVWARALVDAGYRVLGIDISADMIQIARDRVPEAVFHSRSFFETALPSCRAVTSLGECFNYLFGEKSRPAALYPLFRNIFQALEPGGLLIFDMAEPGRGRGARLKHWRRDDWEIVAEVEEDEKAQKLTRHITTFRRVGELYRRDSEVHELQLYRRGEILRELRSAGFRSRTLSRYGEMAFPRSWVGFLAKKP